jgi:hypothetical protein
MYMFMLPMEYLSLIVFDKVVPGHARIGHTQLSVMDGNGPAGRVSYQVLKK